MKKIVICLLVVACVWCALFGAMAMTMNNFTSSEKLFAKFFEVTGSTQVPDISLLPKGAAETLQTSSKVCMGACALMAIAIAWLMVGSTSAKPLITGTIMSIISAMLVPVFIGIWLRGQSAAMRQVITYALANAQKIFLPYIMPRFVLHLALTALVGVLTGGILKRNLKNN